jgi:serine/threonine-protein kinase
MSASRHTTESSRPPRARDVSLHGLFVDDRRRATSSNSTRRDSPRAFRAAASASATGSSSTASARRAPREKGTLARGAVLDKYRVESLLGTGGFAAVYRATHLLLRVPVAIKLLRPRVLERDPGIARQLLEEARYAARINHPNVVRIHDVTHTDEITYIVMEYIEGQSLAKAIETRGPLPAAEVVALAIDVAEGLRAGLEEGLIHRDIKPANILVTKSGRARIVDFGLAYAGSLNEKEHDAPTGQVVGTRGYMAPEQAKNPRRVDFRADVYALGVTLCQALTGVGPYSMGAPRGESDVLRCVPALLAPLLRRMIAASPDDRPTSYEALLSALRHAAQALEPK